jgi:hypothetical protein
VNARATTVSDLVRALSGGRVQQAIDAAIRGEAETIAATLAQLEIDAAVERRAPGEYVVRAIGPDLFAREFGSIDRAPEQPLDEAVRRRIAGGIE